MSFWKMMRGTEPTFAGMRTPRQFVEDDARLTRLVNPQERYRSLQEIVPQGTRSSDSKDALEASAQDLMTTQERRDKLKGAVGGLGSILAGAFQQEPQRQLQFAPVNMGENVPIIDPRYMRYAGSRKKGGSVPVGSYVKVHDDEKVLNLGDGDVEVVPADEVRKLKDRQIDLRPTEELPPYPDMSVKTVTRPLSGADKLGQQVDAIFGKEYYNRKNEDGSRTYGKDFDHKRDWKDSLRSAGYGLLQSLATAPPTNDLGSLLGRAIGGAGTGAVLGATMDNVDEKMRDRLKLAQILPQYQQAAEVEQRNRDAQYKQAQTLELLGRPAQRIREIEARSKAAIDRINRNADIKAGIAKPVINESGYIELEYLNSDASGKRRENELLKGADGQPIFVPGEQGLTWIDPLTKKPMQVRAKQTLMPGATIATGNANRQTEADKANAEKYWRTQDINIQNQMKWMSDIKSLMTQAIAADSGVADDTGTRTEMDAKLNEIKALSNSPLPDTDDPSKAQEDRVKRVNKLVDDYNQLQNQFLTNISKTAAGKAKADQIRGVINSMTKPEVLTYEPYKPTMVTGGVGGRYAGQSFPSPEALQKAFPGKSVADIKAIVEGQGGRFLN